MKINKLMADDNVTDASLSQRKFLMKQFKLKKRLEEQQEEGNGNKKYYKKRR